MADVAFSDSLSPDRVEYAYGLAIRAQESQWQHFADQGWRAALARDEKLLIALEKMSEYTLKLSEEQMGQTRRSIGTPHAHTREHTEHQLCREAYKLCDEGRPIRNFEWIYGAAAWLCGYIVR